MHSFLKSIGFTNIKKRKQIEVLVNDVLKRPDQKVISEDEYGNVWAELSREYAPGIGIAVRGEYIDETFVMDYYFPYFCGTGITTREKIEIERHSETDSYAGVCDDVRIGVTLIFYVQNALEYRNKEKFHGIKATRTAATLSALAGKGKILLPMKKVEKSSKKDDSKKKDRSKLIAAAREGNEEAIESLTLEDMDTYSMISRRILYEDILTIVESYFMPYGIESDQYQILGEIIDYQEIENHITEEKLYIMTVNCNDMIFDVCINQKDLLGQPAIGRRFKGNIWMQGTIHYEN